MKTIEDLRDLLKSKRVPGDSYSLSGGLPNEAYCISPEGSVCEVYYSERGKKTDLREHASQEEAVRDILDRMKKAKLV